VKRRWGGTRFDDTPEDPQAGLVNLVDIMLVFVCGLLVALVSALPELLLQQQRSERGAQVRQGKELAEMPPSLRGRDSGTGMQPVGQVFRDPATGKLILVGN
jgi:hypothetical protein